MKTGRVQIVIGLVLAALVVLLGVMLSGGGGFPTWPSFPTETSLLATPEGASTPRAPRALTICQAAEPRTLFLYGGLSAGARNVMEAIYDGPIDTLGYQFQPVILEKLPSLDDGDVVLRTVEAVEGRRVISADGVPVDLQPGVAILNGDGQEVLFEGGVVTMTQMVVTFELLDGVSWSDGQPLTADDSVYAYELAGEFEQLPLRLELLRERTEGYEATGERVLVWTSLPGYQDTFSFYSFAFQNFYVQNFVHPLPRHFWGMASGEHLLNAEIACRTPIGWGPFVVAGWVDGEYITLVRNPHYFRAGEGLPYLDRVTFRFVSDFGSALDGLLDGTCDVMTQDVIDEEEIARLMAAAGMGLVELVTSSSSEWEHLDFGIDSVWWYDRPPFFGDVRVRQAVARCVDRSRIAREAPLYSEAAVAHSYVSSEHPLYAGGAIPKWGYDVAAGRALLEDVGWRDDDGDGVREARGVAGVTYGTPFSVTLLTTSGDPARQRTVDMLSENLAACGIGMAVRYLAEEDFFADGPDGPVFGRQFDLALFSWRNDLDAHCGLFLSSQVPEPDNWWATSNDSGYASVDYDAACLAALSELPGTDAYVKAHREAQRIFGRDLPVLPLYVVPKVVVVRPEVQGVIVDPSEHLSDLWSIELFDVAR
jgi:peptide/nickel transport system substrate-binding protein